MQLSIQNASNTLQNMAAAAQGAATQALDFTVGSTLRAIFQAVSGVSLWLQWLIVLVLSATRLATSNGTDCDTFGADFGFIRLGATAAGGPVTFARYSTTQAAQLPVGTLVKTNDGTQAFTVNLDTTNAAYQADPTGLTQGWYNLAAGTASISVNVTASVAGTGGNVLAGTIGLISASVPYIDTVTNPAGFTNGIAAESDPAYKARFANYLASLSKGTPNAVAKAAASVAANLTFTIQENTAVGGGYQPGNFVIYVDDGSGATPAATLALIATQVNLVRPIGSTFNVLAATELLANVSMTISCATAAQKAIAIPQVATAINSFIQSLPEGSVLPYGRLAQLAFDASANITNISAPVLNGSNVDIGGGAGQVVRPGSITIS